MVGEGVPCLGCVFKFLGMLSPLPTLQERRAGSHWGRRRGECCVEGEGFAGGRRTKGLRRGVSRPRKELKDPDQLYTTLKNLLAQIKVGRRGSVLGVPAPVARTPSGVGGAHRLGWGRSGPGSSSAFLCSPTPVPGPSWSL